MNLRGGKENKCKREVEKTEGRRKEGRKKGMKDLVLLGY